MRPKRLCSRGRKYICTELSPMPELPIDLGRGINYPKTNVVRELKQWVSAHGLRGDIPRAAFRRNGSGGSPLISMIPPIGG
jgi:hypothetical protein